MKNLKIEKVRLKIWFYCDLVILKYMEDYYVVVIPSKHEIFLFPKTYLFFCSVEVLKAEKEKLGNLKKKFVFFYHFTVL